VTIGLLICSILLIVNFNQLHFSRCFWNIKLQRYRITILTFWAVTLIFGVTWRHLSHDHWTCNVRFPIGSQYEPTMYLARLLTYCASKILGSRPWPFRITWRHQSHDCWTHDMQFPIGDLLKPSLYLASLLRYYVSVLSQAYSDWKCIDPHFCVLRGKIGVTPFCNFVFVAAP